MPSVGNISFTIACIDEASATIKKANDLFSNFRSNVMQSSNDVVKSYNIQKTAFSAFDDTINNSSKIFSNFNRFNEFDRQSNSIKSNIKSLDSLSDTFNTIDMASNNFVAKLWVVNFALKSLSDFATESLKVAQNAEIANLRLNWMADSLYYGANASNEAKEAFQKFATTISTTGLGQITSLSQMGYDVTALSESYKLLEHTSKIAGVSLTELMRDLGGSSKDLAKYGISETVFDANRVAIQAKQIQLEYRYATNKVLDYDVALAQARMNIYSSELEQYSGNWSEFIDTAEGASAHFKTISDKFMNALGRIYNVGLAPILNGLGAIMDIIASSPIAAAIAGLTLAGSAIAVLSVTVLPQFINTISKTVIGVNSFVSAMIGFAKSFNAQTIASVTNTIANIDNTRIALILNEVAVLRNKNAFIRNSAAKNVNAISTANLTATEKIFVDTLSKNNVAMVIANAHLFKNNALKTIAAIKSKINANAQIMEGVATRYYGSSVELSTWQLIKANVAEKASIGLMKQKIAASGLNLKSMFSLTRVMGMFKTGGGGIISVLKLLKTGFITLIPTVISFGATAIGALVPILAVIWPIILAVGALVAAFFAFKAAYESNFGGFANLVNGIGGMIKSAFDGIVSFLRDLWETIISPIQEAFSSLFSAFSDGSAQLGIFDLMLQSIQNVISVISTIAGPFLEFIKGTLKLIGMIIGKSIALPIKLLAKLFEPFGKMFANFSNTVGDLSENPVFKFLADVFGKWSDNISAFFDVLFVGIDILSNDIYNAIVSFFDAIVNNPVVKFILNLISVFGKLYRSIVMKLLGGIWSGIVTIYDILISVFTSIIKHPVFKFISNTIQSIIDMFNKVNSLFKDVSGSSTNRFTSGLQQTSYITNNIVKPAATASEATSKVYTTIGTSDGSRVTLGDMHITINADGLDSKEATKLVDTKLQMFKTGIVKEISSSMHSSFGSNLL